ncbi:MAG: hypothetical protein SOZ04_00590 [Bacilli bacterium]|nr:hypothetical protein [Bacilli bacterium]
MNMKDEEPKIINNFIKLISTNNAPLVDATFLSLNLSKNAKISSPSQDSFNNALLSAALSSAYDCESKTTDTTYVFTNQEEYASNILTIKYDTARFDYHDQTSGLNTSLTRNYKSFFQYEITSPSGFKMTLDLKEDKNPRNFKLHIYILDSSISYELADLNTKKKQNLILAMIDSYANKEDAYTFLSRKEIAKSFSSNPELYNKLLEVSKNYQREVNKKLSKLFLTTSMPGTVTNYFYDDEINSKFYNIDNEELNYMTFLASKASDNNLPVYLNTKNLIGSYVSIVPYVQTINLEKDYETMVYQRDELNYPNYSITITDKDNHVITYTINAEIPTRPTMNIHANISPEEKITKTFILTSPKLIEDAYQEFFGIMALNKTINDIRNNEFYIQAMTEKYGTRYTSKLTKKL